MVKRGVAPPPLPLGAVHCGVFQHRFSIDKEIAAFVEMMHDITDARVDSTGDESVRGRIVRALSSLPRLARLDVVGKPAMATFDGVKVTVPRSVEHLSLFSDRAENAVIVRFLSANSFPSLTSLSINFDAISSAVIAAVVRSCPALVHVFLHGTVAGNDVVTLLNGCQSLRKLTVNPNKTLTVSGAASAASFPRIQELVAQAASSGFLALFPNLVRLEFRGRQTDSDIDLTAVGGMKNLEHLFLDGYDGEDYEGDSCRRFVPLITHPMTRERRPLKSLVLWNFRCGDLGDFLSSPWCSHLVELQLSECVLSDSALERLTASHGATLSTTLCRLTMQCTEADGRRLGRFVAALSSLRELDVISYDSKFDASGFLHEMGRIRSRLYYIRVEVPGCDGDRINVAL